MLISGSNHAAGVALFRATAGVAIAGAGRILRPRLKDICFLPQQPYLPPGTLRQILENGEHGSAVSDDRSFPLLRELNLEQVVTEAGGLDTERDWRTLLPLREQQLLAFVHVLLAAPQFVFLDRVGAALGSDQVDKILKMLAERSISCINIGAAGESPDLYDAVLECRDDGGWAWTAKPATHGRSSGNRAQA